MISDNCNELEHKFSGFSEGLSVTDGTVIEGYASYFGQADQGGDVVQAGAYAKSLAALRASGRSVKMLWQHDPAQPIGTWDEVREDARGLYVKGRILPAIEKGREAVALIGAGAIDGLSIGYRTRRASKSAKGQRLLEELELWEVSLVPFPCFPVRGWGPRARARMTPNCVTWRRSCGTPAACWRETEPAISTPLIIRMISWRRPR